MWKSFSYRPHDRARFTVSIRFSHTARHLAKSRKKIWSNCFVLPPVSFANFDFCFLALASNLGRLFPVPFSAANHLDEDDPAMPSLLTRRRPANVPGCDAGGVVDFGSISVRPSVQYCSTHQSQGPVVGMKGKILAAASSLLKAVAIECATTQIVDLPDLEREDVAPPRNRGD
jgi:hypothetical protein